MLYHLILLQAHLPGWLQSPEWLRHLSRVLGAFFFHGHQTLGLFGAIFVEELGVPLPAPGDAWIMWGGYLTTRGEIPYAMAYVSVVGGAVCGSFILFSISKRYGHPFLVRFGRYIGLTQERLDKTERQFRRWGPWAIIFGRHIPGMRIVLSAFAGVFEVPARVFVPCVFVSSLIWATIFLELGRVLGRNSRFLFRLVPAHLLPWGALILVVGVLVFLAYEHGWRPRRHASQPPALPLEGSKKVASRP
jgi:membrane protein DedA with SNARE-associated domain